MAPMEVTATQCLKVDEQLEIRRDLVIFHMLFYGNCSFNDIHKHKKF